MSGSLSSISAIAGKASTVFSAVSQLFGGAGGVQLGPITFAGMEVPEKIKWGGKQDIVSQRLPGGVVNFNAMGIDYAPISWSGIFEGFNAISRSRALYAMLNSASLFSLTWNDRNYTVMLSEYHADDTKQIWIPYALTCLVLRDETLSAPPAAPSLLAQVQSNIANALGITPEALASTVGTAIQVAQTAATVVNAVAPGSAAALALGNAVGGAMTAINGAIAISDSAIGGIVSGALSSGSPVLPAGTAASGAASLTAATTATGNGAALANAGGQIGVAQANLQINSPAQAAFVNSNTNLNTSNASYDSARANYYNGLTP